MFSTTVKTVRNSIVELLRGRPPRFCNDAVVAIATTQVVLGQYQVGNSFVIFLAKVHHRLVFGKVMLKHRRGLFLRHGVVPVVGLVGT